MLPDCFQHHNSSTHATRAHWLDAKSGRASGFVQPSVAADAAIRFLERNKASSDVIFAANLAVDEIVTNIIKYGYEDSLTHEIIVRLTLVEGSLEIETCDDGKAFHPFSQPEPDASSAAHEVGGLGIHLVRSMLARTSGAMGATL
ncbi:MAG: ATP-binding protein [Terrimicrobiaceae bacterium]